MNISIKISSSDVCDKYTIFKHIQNHSKDQIKKYNAHKLQSSLAIKRYLLDSQSSNDDNNLIFSMDLQKGSLLPIISGSAKTIFIS